MKTFFAIVVFILSQSVSACEINCAAAISVGVHAGVLSLSRKNENVQQGLKGWVETTAGKGRIDIKLVPYPGQSQGTARIQMANGSANDTEMPTPAVGQTFPYSDLQPSNQILCFPIGAVTPKYKCSSSALKWGQEWAGLYSIGTTSYLYVFQAGAQNYVCNADANSQCTSAAWTPSFSYLSASNTSTDLDKSKVCGDGYALSGTDCVGTEPTDGNNDILMGVDSAWSLRQSDPDNSGTTPKPAEISADGKGIDSWGKNPDTGQPVVIEVRRESDGSGTVKIREQEGGNIRDTDIRIGPDGTVRGIGQTSAPGSISIPTATETGSGGTGSTPTVTGGPTAPGSLGSNGFPSDYARSGEASAAADKIVNALKESQGNVDLADLPVPESSDLKSSFFGDTFTDLLGWRLPTHASECPRPTFDLFGDSITLTTHCEVIAEVKNAIIGLFMLVWTIMAFRVVMSA